MNGSLWRRIACAALLLPVAGCTALREIPRTEYASVPERKNVRVVTRDGLMYEFDQVSVQGDSLLGYRHRDESGPAEDVALVRVPLDDVTKLSSRRVDWYRTGLIGGGVVAAVVARGLASSGNSGGSADGGGGKNPGNNP